MQLRSRHAMLAVAGLRSHKLPVSCSAVFELAIWQDTTLVTSCYSVLLTATSASLDPNYTDLTSTR